MASEIERLPDLEGYLKFASIPDWRRVRLTPVTYAEVVRGARSNKSESTPTPASAASAAVVPSPADVATAAEAAAAPLRSPKPRTPVGRRVRKPKAAATQGTGITNRAAVGNDRTTAPPPEPAPTPRDGDGAGLEEGKISGGSDGTVQNPGQGSELPP